jgi:hypothetical protein
MFYLSIPVRNAPKSTPQTGRSVLPLEHCYGRKTVRALYVSSEVSCT